MTEIIVAGSLLVMMLVSMDIGYRIGHRRKTSDAQTSIEVIGTVDAAVFGLLGLILAFTFSGASDRLALRRTQIVQEANAIGTAYLRIDVLAQSDQPAIRELFRSYLEKRIEVFDRVAGNVTSPEIMGSLQYAGAHLQTPLFLVLGHEGCGAVKAALQHKFEGVALQSRIQLLINNILPGLPQFNTSVSPKEKLQRAIESNVRWSMQQIRETPEWRNAVKLGTKLQGAVFEIGTGRVRFLEQQSATPNS
jgi:hypothetical protein